MKPLIILEMANNHMGDLDHAYEMINQFKLIIDQFNEFEFAWKFQFRDLSTFIHTSYINSDHKYVKRFKETELNYNDFLGLKQYIEDLGYYSICTAFDEDSVDNVVSMNFKYIKVASCSFTDWPLLNKIVQYDLPIILSTAGSSIDEIDNVVSFLKHRNKNFSLLHCVGQYPTPHVNLQLNQINLLKSRYSDINIGYSTHENPDELDSVKIAIAKGASIIEKHVGLNTDKYKNNSYSVDPNQLLLWLNSAKKALEVCGILDLRPSVSLAEQIDLRQFKRAVFALKDIKRGDVIDKNKDIYYAWPAEPDQILANDVSKYSEFTSLIDIKKNQGIFNNQVAIRNLKEDIWNYVQTIKSFINNTNCVIPNFCELEISHHYGLDNFNKYGLSMITIINNDSYCKKLLILLPNQTHPKQYHKQKKETFVILYGSINLNIDNNTYKLNMGDTITILPNQMHSFYSEDGCIIEEISSTHYKEDSYYEDLNIMNNLNRKTIISYWK